MKIQCPHCNRLVHIEIQQFVNKQEIFCNWCNNVLQLMGDQRTPVTFQFFLTDAVPKDNKNPVVDASESVERKTEVCLNQH